MPLPLYTRLDRVEGQRIAAAAEPGSAAIRPALRAEAAMGAVIRSALARAGVDPAEATRLAFAEEAVAPPAVISDTAESQRECANGIPLANADDSPRPDDWRWRDALPAGSRPISPTHPSPNYSPGRSPDERLGRGVYATLFPMSLAVRTLRSPTVESNRERESPAERAGLPFA
jgi:hypothetical protein